MLATLRFLLPLLPLLAITAGSLAQVTLSASCPNSMRQPANLTRSMPFLGDQVVGIADQTTMFYQTPVAGTGTSTGATLCGIVTGGFRFGPVNGDYVYDVGEYLPLIVMAPTTSYSAPISGLATGWDYLFCDPSLSATAWPSYAVQYQDNSWGTNETAELFLLSLTVNSSMIGQSWTFQVARAINSTSMLSFGVTVVIS